MDDDLGPALEFPEAPVGSEERARTDSSESGERPRRRRRRGGRRGRGERGPRTTDDRERRPAGEIDRVGESHTEELDQSISGDEMLREPVETGDEFVEVRDSEPREGGADGGNEEGGERGRRRRRGRGRGRDRERGDRDRGPAKADADRVTPRHPEDDHEEVADGDDHVDDHGFDLPGEDDEFERTSHRGIPSWDEAMAIIVNSNLDARAKHPNASNPPRGRGGRGRGGRGRSGGH